MSLYHEAAAILGGLVSGDGSLKSRVYGHKDLKSPKAQIYALVSETLKWNGVLVEIIDRSQILIKERKLSPLLALPLVHDILITKNGIALPASHPLRMCVERNKARLRAELSRSRVQRRCSSLDALRYCIHKDKSGIDNTGLLDHPRWVRVNALRTTLSEQMEKTFRGYRVHKTVGELLKSGEKKALHVDIHIPNLLALPLDWDASKEAAYRNGSIILQDKASCFPAYLLDMKACDGDTIDACAAPGNKTTHLAAIVSSLSVPTAESKPRRIWAFERDKGRSEILADMVGRAGAEAVVIVKPGQDFLRVEPSDKSWSKVEALLLDPSCSGSGMLDRDETPRLIMPKTVADHTSTSKGTKRKRGSDHRLTNAPELSAVAPKSAAEALTSTEALSQRLKSLSTFQLKLLLHAFAFPRARRITYSTCSIHAEENEDVVLKALSSPLARELGWRVLERHEQVPGLKSWPIRGDAASCAALLSSTDEAAKLRDACIRCNKGDEQRTMGFFVAGFVRDIQGEVARKV